MASGSPPKVTSRAVRLFEAKARKGARRCRLEERAEPLLVGFSGGADSTALLLWLAAQLPADSLLALHVDHGLRPEGAERDAAHAERFCRERGIPFRRVRVRVPARTRRGPEAAAREARRAVFLSVAREAGARAVALAHTRDDQVETVLMRLIEGSGLGGLAGMRPEAPLAPGDPSRGEEVLILRPLLDATRAEARAYLKAQGVRWVEDETNADERRLRNLLRRRVWPAIEEALGAGAGEGVAASAERLAGALEVLEEAVRRAEEEFLAGEGAGVRIAPLSSAARLPQAVRAGLWRAALEGARRPATGGRAGRRPLGRLIEGIDRLAREGGPSAKLDLPGKLEARRNYDSLVIGPPARPLPPPQAEIPLAVPGRTAHPELGIAVEAADSPGEAEVADGRMSALLDADRLGKEAVLRARREGDRFHPAGARRERKLKELLIDRKVPRAARGEIPLVAAGQEVAWLIGHGVSEKFRAHPGSRRRVRLRAVALPKPSPKEEEGGQGSMDEGKDS